ncbi:hypothetical protein YC2023_005440 [Brassica napus]
MRLHNQTRGGPLVSWCSMEKLKMKKKRVHRIRVSKRRDRQIRKSKSESEKVKLEREYRLVLGKRPISTPEVNQTKRQNTIRPERSDFVHPVLKPSRGSVYLPTCKQTEHIQ